MEPFKINEEMQIIDLFLYFPKLKILAIGDAHLGYEEALTKQGVLIPKFQFREIMERTERALEQVKPKRIVVVGDLKHEFGYISQEEWRQVLQFIDLLEKYGEVILIKGNHDKILGPIAQKRDLEVVDHYSDGTYYFCHGHEMPKDIGFQSAETVIIGHEHPAVGLKDGPRTEVFKCFLKGKYKDKELVVLPSISSLPEGSDVLKEKLMSPLLKKGINDFRAFVVEDKVYDFGLVKNLRNRPS